MCLRPAWAGRFSLKMHYEFSLMFTFVRIIHAGSFSRITIIFMALEQVSARSVVAQGRPVEQAA